MEVELDNFQDGRPILLNMNQEIASKVKILKSKKQYKELHELALTLPNNKQKYLLQANACLHLKKWKQLADVCDRGLDLPEDNQSSDFYNLKGKAMGKLGNFQQKVNLTLKAIEIDNKVAAYHRNLGAAYYKLKQYNKAIDAHNKAISLEPNHSINYHNKGAAYFRLQNFPNALTCFEKATNLDKKQAISFGWLGDTLKEMTHYDKAREAYLRAYQLSDQENFKNSVRQMQQKINPNKKKGFFARIFG